MKKLIEVFAWDGVLRPGNRHTYFLRDEGRLNRACQLFRAVSFLCCTAPVLAQSISAQGLHQDNQAWPEIDISSKVGERLDVTLLSQLRLTSTLPDPEIYLLGLETNITLNRHVVITPSYYFYRFDRTADTVGFGHNLGVAAAVKWEKHGYKVEDRNRFNAVFRIDDNFWIYGNRLRVEHNIGCATSQDFVFLWDELSYFSNTGAWRRNRVAVGFHKALNERMAVEPYYLHQTDGHSRPGDLNTLGIILHVRFP